MLRRGPLPQGGLRNWRSALPLFAYRRRTVYRDQYNMSYTVPRFCGEHSEPRAATSYECELTLRDPDGVDGQAQQRVTVATRGERNPTRADASSMCTRPTMKPRQERVSSA